MTLEDQLGDITMNKSYKQFMAKKNLNDQGVAVEVELSSLNPALFDFQKAITRWALRKGRALIGGNCGTGKGPIQLEYQQQIIDRRGGASIMFAPPGVKTQFKYEAAKFGYTINIANEDDEIRPMINVTNYERLIKRETVEIDNGDSYFNEFAEYKPIEVKRQGSKMVVERFRFNPNQFIAISLDEASIMKHHDAKTRERLTRFAKNIPFRLCATATPAPNDFFELSNYAEFSGIMNGRQIKANYFIQDGNTSNQFRLKRPAIDKWWKFVSEWAVIFEKPSDLGYSDEGYDLTDLVTNVHVVNDTEPLPGQLIPMPAKSIADANKIKRKTLEKRMKKVVEIAIADDDHKIIFIRLNDEGILLNKLIPDSVEVAGRHSDEVKEERLIGFAQGKYKILITKPEIGGFGLNFQEYCHRVISGNINYSSEEMYQYIRRVWRFGQTESVTHDIVIADTESNILMRVEKKNKNIELMTREVVKRMEIHDLNKENKTKRTKSDYREDIHIEDYWTLMMGDSCRRVHELENRSVNTVVTSVPFPAMYAYTNLDEDIGNYETAEALCEHLEFVFAGLLPKMKPGSIAHIHITQGIAFQNRHGYSGLWDFRGPLVKMMRKAGWEFYSEITIEKDPQTQAARNKSHQLMQKTVFANAAILGASVPDYLLMFKAPGEKENVKPLQSYYPGKQNENYKYRALLSDPEVQGKYVSPDGWITMDMWINWASNVWLMYRKGMKWWEGINVTRVLGSLLNSKTGEREGYGIREGRGEDDEQHLCELQLDVIERCIAIHTKPGDMVCDPFNGIGSTGYQALEMGRRYLGLELKPSYYYTAIKNLQYIEGKMKKEEFDLFSLGSIEVEGDECLKRHRQWMSKRGISLYDRATKWHNWEAKRPKIFKAKQEVKYEHRNVLPQDTQK
jgi:DNA modification methylase